MHLLILCPFKGSEHPFCSGGGGGLCGLLRAPNGVVQIDVPQLQPHPDGLGRQLRRRELPAVRQRDSVKKAFQCKSAASYLRAFDLPYSDDEKDHMTHRANLITECTVLTVRVSDTIEPYPPGTHIRSHHCKVLVQCSEQLIVDCLMVHYPQKCV